jgi:hypothetical protein
VCVCVCVCVTFVEVKLCLLCWGGSGSQAHPRAQQGCLSGYLLRLQHRSNYQVGKKLDQSVQGPERVWITFLVSEDICGIFSF